MSYLIHKDNEISDAIDVQSMFDSLHDLYGGEYGRLRSSVRNNSGINDINGVSSVNRIVGDEMEEDAEEVLTNDSVRKEIPFSFSLDSATTTYNLERIDTVNFSWRFYMENSSDTLIEIDSISTGCECMAPKRNGWKIKPGEVEPLDLDFDMSGYSGAIGRKVQIFFKSGEKRELILLFEL